MGWWSKLFGDDLPEHGAVVPPIVVHPLRYLQVVDLRAVADAAFALDTGMRVAIEMIRTTETPRQRAFAFSRKATQALLGLPSVRLAELARSMRTHLPSRTSFNDEIFFGSGEVAVLVNTDELARAAPVLATVELLAVPIEGPGSNDILATIGPPTRSKGFAIGLPSFTPDVISIDRVPGVALRWKGEALLDLRRIGTGNDMSFATSFVAAKMAMEEVGSIKRRTWVIAPWQLGSTPEASLERATNFAREAIAVHRPEVDRVVFDGRPSAELVRWVEDLGLDITERTFALSAEHSLTYPQLAMNWMLEYAIGGR